MSEIISESSQSPKEASLMEALEKLGFDIDVHERAEFVASLGAEDLAMMSAVIHSKVAPDVDQNPVDTPMSVGASERTTILTEPENRFRLFEEAAEYIQKLAADTQPGEEQLFLNRACNLAALAVVLAHPFEDGNGRTARTLSLLIRDGYNPQDAVFRKDLALAATARPIDEYRIESFAPKFVDNKVDNDVLAAAASLDVPFTDTDSYAKRVYASFSSPYSETQGF